LRENILDEIVLPHRNSTGYKQHLMFQPLFDLRTKIFEIVASNAQEHRLAAPSQHLPKRGVAIAVANLTAFGILANLHEFVTRRQNCDTRLSRNRNLDLPKTGKRSDIRQFDALSLRQNTLAFFEF